MDELAAKHKIMKKDLSPARIAEWMRVLEASNFDPRLRERQAEARVVYDALGMSNVTGPVLPMPATAKVPDSEPVTTSTTPKTKRKRQGSTIGSAPVTSHTIPTTPIANALEPERTFDEPYDLL
jgi:hypothetical protein